VLLKLLYVVVVAVTEMNITWGLHGLNQHDFAGSGTLEEIVTKLLLLSRHSNGVTGNN